MCILCIGADGIKNLGKIVFIFLINLFDPQDKIDLSLFKVNFNLFANIVFENVFNTQCIRFKHVGINCVKST